MPALGERPSPGCKGYLRGLSKSTPPSGDDHPYMAARARIRTPKIVARDVERFQKENKEMFRIAGRDKEAMTGQ
jgi:hypothetical protein